MSARILIVDDDRDQRELLAELLRSRGWSTETAADGFRGTAKLDDFEPDVVITDLKMPGMDGLELMYRAHRGDPDRSVIVITGHGNVASAVAAMREGAAHYLTKPLNLDELVVVVERELERRRLVAETGQLRRRLAEHQTQVMSGLVGSDPELRKICDIILQVAPTRATVLITGESGTGKSMLASALHEHSGRASRPLIKLHCSALAESLLESELFGHEPGAFTGALARHDGKFQQAHGGTLFLDEIGDISPRVQVKLLRFLQDQEFERVGGSQTQRADVRVVAATNRDLKRLVAQGNFREDLYFRLNVVTLHMPPLRERPSDIAVLAMHFLHRHAKHNGKQVEGFSDAALEKLTRHSWPVNVRELENAVERAVVICRGDQVQSEDLSLLGVPGEQHAPRIPGSSLADVERYTILKTLEYSRGCKNEAARILGISARTIRNKLHEYGAPGEPSGHPLIGKMIR